MKQICCPHLKYLIVIEKSIVFAHTRNTSLDHCSHYCPLFFSGPVGLMVISFPVWIGAIIYLAISIGSYKKSFKVGIIEQIIRAIDPNLSYNSSKAVDKAHFKHSELYKKSWNEYKGDDYVQGMVGKTSLEFQRFTLSTFPRIVKVVVRHQRFLRIVSSGRDFNKSFKGKTFVLPDTAEKLFGSIGSMLQSWNAARGELIKMEDVAFEREFVVYGDDQIEARYILSTSLMERILAYKKKAIVQCGFPSLVTMFMSQYPIKSLCLSLEFFEVS